MTNNRQSDRVNSILYHIIKSMVANDGRDLTARQMAVLLIAGTQDGPHTVRGLAGRLNVAKPAITRALDRLQGFDLIIRQVDNSDRRSVLVRTTHSGKQFIRDLKQSLARSQRDI